jgi:hypothetical protein
MLMLLVFVFVRLYCILSIFGVYTAETQVLTAQARRQMPMVVNHGVFRSPEAC